jgi:hypothetical protein
MAIIYSDMFHHILIIFLSFLSLPCRTWPKSDIFSVYLCGVAQEKDQITPIITNAFYGLLSYLHKIFPITKYLHRLYFICYNTIQMCICIQHYFVPCNFH